ncbi:MAG TPA: hypothetical protein VK826_00005, partial [Bacteroidia bacterium]|nr:hypothetical protein [Bacteroidia bacterium]
MKNNSPRDRNKMLLLAIALFALFSSSYAQNPSLKVFEQWRDTAGSQNTFYKASTITIPGTTHVLVCGATLNGNGNGDYDMLVEKIDGAGTVLWAQQYDGAGHGDDIAADVEVNASTGDVYITGCYYENATDSSNAVTIMYNISGVQQWVATYNGTGSQFDATIALFVDNSNGDVFAAGLEWSGVNLYDMLLIRYDNTGAQQWVNTLDYASGNDGLNKIGMSVGKPYVGGGIQDMFGSYEYAVYAFDLSSGGLGFGSSSVGTTPGFNRLADLAIDDTGNVYITGFTFDPVTKYDIRTIKLDSNLNVVWSWDYDAGYNMDDEGTGLALDSHNNVIVVGYSETAFNGKNYTILKYNNAGALQWIENYDDPYFGDDSASAVVIGKNDTDAIYVTGYSFNGSTNDYRTMKLDGQGNPVWAILMNSQLNGDDKATAISLDSLGDVIVSGQNKLGDSVFAYTTVKYIEKNTTLHKDTISFTSSSFVFTENRGQLLGTDTAEHPEVRFYTLNAHPAIYFMDTAVSYVFLKNDTSVANTDSIARVDMKFVSSNSDQRIRALDVRDDYCNFFLDHLQGGRSRVQNYNQLVSFDVWNGVDVIYGSNMAGFKYYFVCKPIGGGGSSNQIDILYEGADSVKIDGSGQLIIYTPFGIVVQPRPQVWQLDASGNYSALAWQPDYTMLGTNEVGFTNFGSYNTAWPLVIAVDRGNIQPSVSTDNLMWSTYYGQGIGDIFRDIKVAHSGEVTVCGHTNSFAFPVANAFQTTYGQQRDAILVNFDPNGARNWATYYGGFSMDAALGLDVDVSGNIYFVGYTYSNPDTIADTHPFYTSSGSAYVDSTQSSGDGFIVNLRADGQFVFWASYLGGTGTDEANAVVVSPILGDIYVVGKGDTAGFPITGITSWNNTYGGGMIWKFHPDGELSYSCFIGPTSNSAVINGILIDSVGNVVIGGSTGTGFPVTAGCAQFTYGGGPTDGFVAKLSGYDDNALIWATYHGGEGADGVTRIDVSPYGTFPNYFATGMTQSNALPVTNPGGGAYVDSTKAGVEDAFVVQFHSTGTRTWATYYG